MQLFHGCVGIRPGFVLFSYLLYSYLGWHRLPTSDSLRKKDGEEQCF